MQNINLEDYKGVYVFAQQVDNELSSIAFELLGSRKTRKTIKYRSYSSTSWIKRWKSCRSVS